jgi:hypothetical protein
MAARARRLTLAAALALAASLLPAPAVLAADQGPSLACQQTPSWTRVGCDAITGGPTGPLQDVAQSGQQALGQATSQAGQDVASSAEMAVTEWLAGGAAWVVQGVTALVVGSSSTPNLDPGQVSAWSAVYGRVVGVALSLSVLLVLIGVMEAVLSQRPGALRQVLVGIAVGGIAMGAIPVGTALLVKVIDDLSAYVAGPQSGQVARALQVMVAGLTQIDPSEGAAAFAFTALVMLLGGGLLWLELMVRSSLIYLFVGVAPLACAAVMWPRREGVLRQVLFAGLALVVSKLVIVVALAVGFAVLTTGVSLQSLIGGTFLILIAALMPFATARVLPLAAEELSALHQGRLRRWGIVAVGTTQQVVAAAVGATAGAGNPPLAVAPSMGSVAPGGPAKRGPSGGGGGAPTGGPSAADAAGAREPTTDRSPTASPGPGAGSPPGPRRSTAAEPPPGRPGRSRPWEPPTDVAPPEVP